MSGSYYALNSKYNQLLALINALPPPIVPPVDNPMTSDLDCGGFDIFNLGTLSITLGSTLDVNGGDFLVSAESLPTTTRREVCELEANGGTYLQHYSENYGNPGAVVVSTSSNTFPFYCPDVGDAAQGGVVFNAGTSWDNASDGLTISCAVYDPILASGTGSIGTGSAGNVPSLYAGACTGMFCKVESPWTFAGGATVRLQVGGLSPGATFTNVFSHSEVYPQNRWAEFAPNTAYEGGQVRLLLNIPVGGSIDTNGFNFFDGYKCIITNITC